MPPVPVSEKPWSAYTEADYSIQQWHNACLIHQHTGPPTSKAQCKLPVKTPNGTLNRNGVIAAAGALAGARTPIQASTEEKNSAARALIRYYQQLNMKPTPKLLSMTHFDLSEFLVHYGIKGMRWGIRRSNPSGSVTVSTMRTPAGVKVRTKGGGGLPPHPDAVAAKIVGQKIKRSGKSAVSNQELQTYANRLELERRVTNVSKSQSNPGKKFVANLLKNIAQQQANNLVNDTVTKQVSAVVRKRVAG
jgi:hypothetical protein